MSENAALEAVAKSVHDLAESVTEMRAGLVDKETVARVAEEVMLRQKEADAAQNRASYKPADEEPGNETIAARFRGPDRLDQILARPAEKVAAAIHRPVDDVKNFQSKADELLLLSLAKDVDPRETAFYGEEFLPAMKAALDSQTTAEGIEFVPRQLSNDLIERINLELRVANLFPQIVMPTQPFDIPAKAVARTRVGYATEQTADTGQTKFKAITPGTRKVTLSAVKFAGEIITSKELEEDSIIAIMPLMQEELVDYISASIEDTLINGDTSGTHQDSDTVSSDDPRKSLTGLRKLAIASAKTDQSAASATTVAMLRTNRKNMKRYGIDPNNLAHVVSMNAYIQLLADPSVITMEKYGPHATIVTGELGKADGSPIIVSEYVRTDLNASGVFDNVTTTRTEVLTVNRRGFVVGERRGMTVQVLRELYAESDQDAIIASVRKAFASRFTSTTEPAVAISYNITS